MSKERAIQRFFSIVREENLYPSVGNLRFRLQNLFDGIDFDHMNILDLGGGNGLFSFYSALKGTKEVICLEPEHEGSTPHVTSGFKRLQALFLTDRVALKMSSIQDFDPGGVQFDIILMHNSINHLDENACIHLLKNQESRERYKDIFLKIRSVARMGAKLIISDCSRHNFFGHFKMKNPLAPHIDWYKHQSPETWIKLLHEIGFGRPELVWTSLDPLRSLGQKLFGNKVGSYFLGSYFILKMDRTQ